VGQAIAGGPAPGVSQAIKASCYRRAGDLDPLGQTGGARGVHQQGRCISGTRARDDACRWTGLAPGRKVNERQVAPVARNNGVAGSKDQFSTTVAELMFSLNRTGISWHRDNGDPRYQRTDNANNGLYRWSCWNRDHMRALQFRCDPLGPFSERSP
jgi:hypothetical protein